MAKAKQVRRPKKVAPEEAGEAQRIVVSAPVGGRFVWAERGLSDNAVNLQAPDTPSATSKTRKARRIETGSEDRLSPLRPREQRVAPPNRPTSAALKSTLKSTSVNGGSIAATIAIAACCGGIVGSLATIGVGKLLPLDIATSTSAGGDLASRMVRIDSELAVLKASVAASAKTDTAVELSGSRAQQAAKGANDTIGPAPDAPPAIGPVVEGWVLRNVSGGSALVEGRPGLIQVMPGDSLPGVGRVDTIRREDGRWVVVTAGGLIVAR